jgi:hypothetical protein
MCGVSISPGRIEFARMPRAAYSIATPRVKLMTAAFDA